MGCLIEDTRGMRKSLMGFGCLKNHEAGALFGNAQRADCVWASGEVRWAYSTRLGALAPGFLSGLVCHWLRSIAKSSRRELS